jgi:murein DD-endopeptidase MepM/ murein hydrolase activator NlpD
MRTLAARWLALAALVAGWLLVLGGGAQAYGGWQPPLRGPIVVVRGFDPPAQRWLPGNRGVDLAARSGQPVFSAGDGVVSFAGKVARVPVVAIRHAGGLETTYEPVLASVAVGSRLTAGALIGHLMVTGSHCRPQACLHWGLRRGSDYLDPLGLIGRAKVRLLPLRQGSGGDAVLRAAAPAGLAGLALCLGVAVPGRLGRPRLRRHRLRPRPARSRRSRRSRRASPPTR